MSSLNMADTGHTLSNIVRLLWGENIKEDIFLRWTQGFNFSGDEPTALIQSEGGPCAVLVPVQAYVLKYIITHKDENDNWQRADCEEQNMLLISAVCEILGKAQSGVEYHVVYFESDNTVKKGEEFSYVYFHNHLRVINFLSIEDVKKFFTQKVDMLRDTYGVLLFLYSVVYTRGLAIVEHEINGYEEPLIDFNHGYGSQVLTNLMITGNAVDNVFNDKCEIGGMALYGIPSQSDVGFLTLLEHLRYCEVGSYLKKPLYPVWVLGSETHLTVLFSFNKKLAGLETARETAIRLFNRLDPDGNNFIKSDSLGQLLNKLGLGRDEQYVKSMVNKLDPDRYGIILQSSFLDEFYPEIEKGCPDTFTLYHYNGQPFSNVDNKVVYRKGSAILLESDIMSVSENDHLLTCLQTRWPNIDIRWDLSILPSLN